MELADLEPVLTKAADDLIGLFEFHGEMAGVVGHTQMRVEPRIGGAISAQSFDKTPEIASHGPLLFRQGDEFLERTGNRADAAFDAVGQELSQEIEQTVCVFDAFVGCPVRPVNLFLDPRAVKSTVGKSIDREN